MQSYHSLSAEVYQLDKPIGSSFGDVEYYAARLQGVQGRILEPAVGTGRILIPLLQQGFAVQGFDPSAAMLDICQQNLKTSGFESSVVFNGQLENFHAQQPYQAIIIPTGSFLLLDQDDKAVLALQNCYQALEVGGRLIFDVFFQHQFKQGESKVKTYKTPQNELISLTMTSSEIDYVEQVTTTHHRYDKWNIAGECIESELEVFKLKWFGLAELKRLLQQVGFSEISMSSDYQYLAVPHNHSEIISIEACKR